MYTFIKEPFSDNDDRNRKQKKPKPDLNLRSPHAGGAIKAEPVLTNGYFIYVADQRESVRVFAS